MRHTHNLAIEAQDKQVLIDLGNAPGWLEDFRDLLLRAQRITLIPKEGEQGVVMSVALNPNRHWVFFRRTFGRTGTNIKIAIYCIGYKENIHGRTVKTLSWLYPNGFVETGVDEPTYAGVLLETLIGDPQNK